MSISETAEHPASQIDLSRAVCSKDDHTAWEEAFYLEKKPVSYRDPEGEGSYAGGFEMIPEERSHEFNLDRALHMMSDRSGSRYDIMHAILEDSTGKVPVVVDVGCMGNTLGGPQPFRDLEEELDYLVNVDILSPLMGRCPNGGFYVSSSVEKLTTVFPEGKRANLIHLQNVLTSDWEGADCSTFEKRRHILKEIGKSLAHGGIVVIQGMSQVMGVSQEDFEETGLAIIAQDFVQPSGYMFIAQKK